MPNNLSSRNRISGLGQRRDKKSVELDSARGSSACCQALTDLTPSVQEKVSFDWTLQQGCGIYPVPYQILPAHAEENSDSELFTTLDYKKVKHFATKRAPFAVFDITRDLADGLFRPGRIAFYFRANVTFAAQAGEYAGILTLNVGQEKAAIKIKLIVYHVSVPALSSSTYNMVNWLKFEPIEYGHGVSRGTQEFWKIVQKYMDNLIDMRNTRLQLPTGVPIRDRSDRVIDFDFSDLEVLGNMALESGFNISMVALSLATRTGNGFIVYPGEQGPSDSVRSHLQRVGSEEAEPPGIYPCPWKITWSRNM